MGGHLARKFAEVGDSEIGVSDQEYLKCLDADSLLRIAVFLPEKEDLVALRAVCRSTRAALSAAGWRYLVYAHTGVALPAPAAAPALDSRWANWKRSLNFVSYQNPELRLAMRAYCRGMHPKLEAKYIGGAHTDNSTYFSRQSMPGAFSNEVLQLRKVWWLDLSANFPDVLPGEYELHLRHSRVGMPFNVTVEAQGTVLEDAFEVRPTLNVDGWFAGLVEYGVGDDYDPVWEQVSLGKVVISGGLQPCHVRLSNTSGSLKVAWALDFLELKRIRA